MNQSQTLTIEVLISLEWFTVQFETDSIERNRLMNVRYNSFLLDASELPLTHPTYYKEIKKEMNKAAENYWNNARNNDTAKEQITGIPTLDYQNVLNPQLAMIKKSLGLAILILLTSFTTVFSQAHVDFGFGAANVIASEKNEAYLAPVMKISAGYQFENNIDIEGMIQPSLTRKVNTSNYLGLKAGYNFQGLLPSVGYLYNYRNADDVSMNRWEAAFALKYQFEVNDNGGLYIEALYTKSSYQATVGFHIIF